MQGSLRDRMNRLKNVSDKLYDTEQPEPPPSIVSPIPSTTIDDDPIPVVPASTSQQPQGLAAKLKMLSTSLHKHQSSSTIQIPPISPLDTVPAANPPPAALDRRLKALAFFGVSTHDNDTQEPYHHQQDDYRGHPNNNHHHHQDLDQEEGMMNKKDNSLLGHPHSVSRQNTTTRKSKEESRQAEMTILEQAAGSRRIVISRHMTNKMKKATKKVKQKEEIKQKHKKRQYIDPDDDGDETESDEEDEGTRSSDEEEVDDLWDLDPMELLGTEAARKNKEKEKEAKTKATRAAAVARTKRRRDRNKDKAAAGTTAITKKEKQKREQKQLNTLWTGILDHKELAQGVNHHTREEEEEEEEREKVAASIKQQQQQKGMGLGIGDGTLFLSHPTQPIEDATEENQSKGETLHRIVPASTNKRLREYQRDGIKFLFRQYALGEGGVLADDMGLGKTVQVVGFLAAILGKHGVVRGVPGGGEGNNNDDDSNINNNTTNGDTRRRKLERIAPLPNDPITCATERELMNDFEDILRYASSGAFLFEPGDQGDDVYAPDYDGAVAYGGPVLIVAPKVVLCNWERELNMWGPSFKSTICQSANKSTALASIISGEKEIMIISVQMMKNLIDELKTVPWHVVIVDEAQCLKNETNQTWKAADMLPTRLRYGLTGTPQSNDYIELYCLMNWAVPGCLGTKSYFQEHYEVPMKLGHKIDALPEDVEEGREAQRRLRSRLAKYLLRRTKELIKHQLPQKHDMIVYIELSDMQLAAYKRLVESPDVNLLLKKGQGPTNWSLTWDQGGVLYPIYHHCDCDNAYDEKINPRGCKNHRPKGCWTKKSSFKLDGKKGGKGGGRVGGETGGSAKRLCPGCLTLPVCSILRKISNHLELVKSDPDLEATNPMQYYRNLEIAKMVLAGDADRLGGGYTVNKEWLKLSDTRHCGKLKALETLLAQWKAEKAADNKVLIFSQSVRMLNIIKALLMRESYDHLVLDGAVPMQERQKIVDTFNDKHSTAFCFLISTAAGGVGITLTAANKVVIFDPSYNPSSDLQAQDRAFRIGQQRNVTVYRFIAAGTMEELIYKRQIYKQQHSNMTVEGKVENRLFKGAQGMKGEEGELWGLVNMLELNVSEVGRVAEERRRREEEARLMAVHPLVIDEEDDGGEGSGSGGRSRQEDGGGGEGGGLGFRIEEIHFDEDDEVVEEENGGNVNMAEYQGDGDDEGLASLLAPELNDSDSSGEEEDEEEEEEEDLPSLSSPRGGGRRKRIKTGGMNELEREAILLANTLGKSMVNIVNHRDNMAGEEGGEEGGGQVCIKEEEEEEEEEVEEMGVLESLAGFLGMSKSEVAGRLLATSEEGRRKILEKYALDGRTPRD